MDGFFNTGGATAEQYASFLGKMVRIYYQDMRGTNRALIGEITRCEGDNLWLKNGEWHGVLNTANAKICIISTIEGWGYPRIETNDETIY
jgi:hypothetical protein